MRATIGYLVYKTIVDGISCMLYATNYYLILACTGSIKWDLQISKIICSKEAAYDPLLFNISLYWLN